MTSQINSILAIAKQCFGELLKLRSIEQLKQQDLGEGSQHERIKHLLAILTNSVAHIERYFADQLFLSNSLPVVEGAPQLLRFYKSKLKPNARLIQEAYFRSQMAFLDSIGITWDLIEGRFEHLYPTPEQKPLTGDRIRNTIETALSFFDETIDDDDERRNENFSFKDTWKVIDNRLIPFQPGEWLQNAHLLAPILTGQPKASIPLRIQSRLRCVYEGFVLNQWFGVIAISRSILEDTLLSHADKLNIDPYSTTLNGKRQYSRLGKLIYKVSKKHPELKNDMEVIKRAGDRILHPKSPDVISLPHIIRDEAFKCLQGIKRTVEYICCSLNNRYNR